MKKMPLNCFHILESRLSLTMLIQLCHRFKEKKTKNEFILEFNEISAVLK